MKTRMHEAIIDFILYPFWSIKNPITGDKKVQHIYGTPISSPETDSFYSIEFELGNHISVIIDDENEI